MSADFTRLYIQYIFAVGDSNSLISKDWELELVKSVTSVLREKRQIPIIVKCLHDHIHIFVVVKPDISIQMLADEIRSETAAFINNKRFTKKPFQWQDAYGAFSYSKTRTNDVYLYLQAQERYHAKRTFREEFVEFLRINAIDYDVSTLPKGLEEFSLATEPGN